MSVPPQQMARPAPKRPMSTRTKVMLVGGIGVGGFLIYILYSRYASNQAAAASSTADTTADEASSETGNQYSDFDPWQEWGPGTSSSSSTTAKQPQEGEKIGSGYYTRGSSTPTGYQILTPQMLHSYHGAYYYQPTKGKMVRMGKTALEPETPLYKGPAKTAKKTMTTKSKS